jgi:dihydrofolate reductase
VRHRTTDGFWECYEGLPDDVRVLADRKFQLLKRDLSHPSLQFKKVGLFWSARIGQNYRALATKDGEDFLWGWLGTHDDYEGMIR